MEVSDTEKPIYYSDWTYAAVQQLTAIADYDTEFKIAERLALFIRQVREVIAFLLRAGLCVESNNKLKIGPAQIHISPDSPWIKQHHGNWRTRALESYYTESPLKLHYSPPMTLSRADCKRVRAILLSSIERINALVDPSLSEDLICISLDLFRIGKI